jgi:hypothetical protein
VRDYYYNNRRVCKACVIVEDRERRVSPAKRGSMDGNDKI